MVIPRNSDATTAVSHHGVQAAMAVKLRPPSASDAQVMRRSIVALVCSERVAPLVLIRAPAGFGKTTTMLQCRMQFVDSGIRTAWLTLDRADNDATRFLTCLLRALSELVSTSDASVGTELSLPEILTLLAQSQQSFVLFIDEMECIRDPGVVGILRDLIVSLPTGGRVVVGTRSVPDLSLGRLRARGHLLEIDANLLRFSQVETDEYLLERRSIVLDSKHRTLLQRKTEGWAAGLWLASAALTRHPSQEEFIARFSGSNLAVADYLADDVLDVQPPSVRTFLLRTSILRELNPSLCQALVPDLDCAAMLKRLQAENVLVSAIDGETDSYRYHVLFADFLRCQLYRELEGQVADLHVVASRWFEVNDRPVRAIDHALEGGDYQNAVRLLDAHAMHLLAQGRLRLLSRWLDAIPPELRVAYPRLAIVRLWSIGLTRGPREALEQLDCSSLDASSDPEALAHVIGMRPILLAMDDRLDEAYQLGMSRLKNLPTGNSIIDSGLVATVANLSLIRRRPEEALELLDFRRKLLGSRSGGMGDAHAECILGEIALVEARLAEATRHFKNAVTASAIQSPDFTKGNVLAAILYAMASHEAGALDEVRNLLQVYLPIARDAGIPDHAILGYRMLSRLAFDRGDVDEAFRVLAELEALGYQRQYERVIASARLERSRIRLIQGHIEASLDELERGSEPAIWAQLDHLNLVASDVESPTLCRLRWEAFAGEPATAAECLAREHLKAIQTRRMHRALKLQVLRAGALERAGDHDRALLEFRGVARICSQEGFVRIVADEMPLVGPLTRQLAREFEMSSADPLLTQWIEKIHSFRGNVESSEEILLHRDKTAATPGPEASSRTSPSVGMAHDLYERDPLTPKELKVLKLLAEGYSNAAMTEKLFVSDSTVRTHLRNINVKLAVSSRTQAIAAARRLGLLR